MTNFHDAVRVRDNFAGQHPTIKGSELTFTVEDGVLGMVYTIRGGQEFVPIGPVDVHGAADAD